ncbi:MAG TPA: AraC family transcriptional regulator [Balneolaceae bacterium]|nr:AraC family transcriptional regulator [Balneolaceae bacterium]
MNAFILKPHRALQPYIRQYVYCEIGEPGKWTHSNMAPPGCTQLSIVAGRANILIGEDDKPANKYEPVTFVGQTTRFKKVSFYDRIKSFFVIFQPYGAYQLLGIHQGECKNLCINLTDLWGSSAKYIREELSQQILAKDIRQVLENYLLKRIPQSTKLENDHLARVVKQINLYCNQHALIEKLCRGEGYSISTLERHMKRMVGMSPKQFQRIVRFNAALKYIKQNGKQCNWSRIANTFGYFDQSHFIKEFKFFYGKTPSEYSLLDNHYLSNIALPKIHKASRAPST